MLGLDGGEGRLMTMLGTSTSLCCSWLFIFPMNPDYSTYIFLVWIALGYDMYIGTIDHCGMVIAIASFIRRP